MRTQAIKIVNETQTLLASCIQDINSLIGDTTPLITNIQSCTVSVAADTGVEEIINEEAKLQDSSDIKNDLIDETQRPFAEGHLDYDYFSVD